MSALSTVPETVVVTTGLQLAILGGVLVGAGLALLLRWLVPSEPDLVDALDRLTPKYARRQALSQPAPSTRTPHATNGTSGSGAGGAVDLRERLGRWAMATLPPRVWGTPPRQELALLRVSLTRFYGEKILFAALGLVAGPVLTFFLDVLGVGLPFLVPVAGSLALAAVMFLLPDYNARDDATRARAEFARALGAYIELVALERRSGSGTRQALERAATVADSWVFRRLAEELRRSRWSGTAPWDALHLLGRDLGVPELDDLADIMRLGGEEGAQVYANLRARGDSLRDAILSAEVAKANATSTRMFIPASLLGVIFMALLLGPSLLRITGT